MSMSLRTNTASMNAQKNLYQNNTSLQSTMAKLSTGYRITRAGDDAAGLGISVNLEAQIRSYSQGIRNAQDGISLVQTAEGALNETSNILARLRELAMQSASSGVGNAERAYIQEEANALTTEIERIAQATEYNGTKLLNNSSGNLVFQVGIRYAALTAANDQITVTQADARAATLVGGATIDMDDATAAMGALATIDTAIASVSSLRSKFGAAGNRLNSVVATAQTAMENLAAGNSRIRDADIAEETSKLARSQVLAQAGVSVLAQANQMPQVALKLLG